MTSTKARREEEEEEEEKKKKRQKLKMPFGKKEEGYTHLAVSLKLTFVDILLLYGECILVRGGGGGDGTFSVCYQRRMERKHLL